MLKCVEHCGPNSDILGQMSTNSQLYFIHINFYKKPNKKKCTIEPKIYTAMLLYLFFDSLLSTYPKKMETEKWPKAADSPLLLYGWVKYITTRREDSMSE